MTAGLAAPPERWAELSHQGWLAAEALAAWELAREPKVDAWLAETLGFRLPAPAYCGVARIEVAWPDPDGGRGGLYQPFPVPGEGGTAALIIPVRVGNGAPFDLVAVDLLSASAKRRALGEAPEWFLRTGLAESLGFNAVADVGDRWHDAWLRHEPVPLARDPVAWLEEWARALERDPLAEMPSVHLLRVDELGGAAFHLLLEGSVVCADEALAAEVAAFRKQHDTRAKKERGKILVKGAPA